MMQFDRTVFTLFGRGTPIVQICYRTCLLDPPKEGYTQVRVHTYFAVSAHVLWWTEAEIVVDPVLTRSAVQTWTACAVIHVCK